jgi:nucleoside phosphorylase
MLRYLMTHSLWKKAMECSAEELVVLGNDPSWQQAAAQSSTFHVQAVLTNRRLVGMTSDTNPNVHKRPTTVLLIAAAASELGAVKLVLTTAFGKSRYFTIDGAGAHFGIEYIDNGTRWVVTTLPFQAQMEAASRIAKLVPMVDPDLVLMVGMCMGMPLKKLPSGTVVVPNEVFSFDHRRILAEGDQYRPHGERTTTGLHDLASLIASEIKDYRVVTDKGLASASTKIEDPDAELIKLIENSFPDAAAFDMEGGGFYRASEGKQCAWIKAVADNGEPQNPTAEGQQEKKTTQSEVTKNAVDFAVRLVRQFVASQ